jgi:tRNA threonylcarbamoyladenosine biosynthesis protein TsaB
MANILLLETATKVCSVGVATEGGILSIREDMSMQYSHSKQLTSFINEVVTEAGLSFSQLDAVAVSKGPGSYTGLRIGVSAAKGLCYAREIPLISVNSLDVLARVAQNVLPEKPDFYVPMIDARRMEVYNAVYDSFLKPIRETIADIIDENSLEEFLIKGKVMLDKIPSFLKNKYLLVLVAVLIWFMFFDQNNLIQQYRYSRQLKDFRAEKEYYLQEIARDSVDLDKLKNNPEELERYAREKYLMKRENEDIFIVPED